MGISEMSSEDQNANWNADIKDCAQEFSDGNENSFGNGIRDHLFYIQAKNLSIFCLCLKPLCEAEFKCDGLINLVDEISR